MVSVEYSIAISEVLDILKNTNEKDVNKISPEFMGFLKDNASKEYVSKFNYTNSIESLELSEKAIGILSVINSEFWCTPEQKKDFDNILNNNENKYQIELRKKYNPDDIFKKKNQNRIEESNNKEENTSMIIVQEEKWYQKIFNVIKEFFRKK